MNLNAKPLLFGCTAFWILSSCSFVEPKPGAELIVLSNDTEQCRKLAETEVTVRDTFMWWEREPETVAQELEVLAQNEAVRLNGNAIWPISRVEKGLQRFMILRCPSR